MILPAVYVLLLLSAIVDDTAAAADNNRRYVRVTAIPAAPFLEIVNRGENIQGFIVDMFQGLRNITGLQFLTHMVRDGRYGSQTANGEWNGMIGELLRNEADIAAGPLTVTEEREAVVDFIPYMEVNLAILMKKRSSSSSLPQINSVLDLGRQSAIKYGAVQSGYIRNFFRNSDDPEIQHMSSVMEENPDVFTLTNDNGVERVLSSTDEEPYAFLAESTSAEYYAMTNCGLAVINDRSVYSRQYGLAVRKDSHQLMSELQQAFGQVKFSFQLLQLYCKWWVRSTPCPCDEARRPVCSRCGLL